MDGVHDHVEYFGIHRIVSDDSVPSARKYVFPKISFRSDSSFHGHLHVFVGYESHLVSRGQRSRNDRLAEFACPFLACGEVETFLVRIALAAIEADIFWMVDEYLYVSVYRRFDFISMYYN